MVAVLQLAEGSSSTRAHSTWAGAVNEPEKVESSCSKSRSSSLN